VGAVSLLDVFPADDPIGVGGGQMAGGVVLEFVLEATNHPGAKRSRYFLV
jgi:hypothetical protein